MTKIGEEQYKILNAEGTPTYTSNSTRQAALHAAKDILDPEPSSTAIDEDGLLTPRERAADDAEEIAVYFPANDVVAVYEAWTWEEQAPENAPNWMPESATFANVEQQAVYDPEEYADVDIDQL